MKIVLINPKPKIWIESKTIPLGLAYIASYLINKGYKNMEVIDQNIYPDKPIPKADVYGITSTTPLIEAAYVLAAKLKKSGAYIVLGGSHPTCLPDEALNKKGVDFVVRGEGEITFYELIKAITEKRPFEDIKGLSYKKNGEIVHNEMRPYIKDLDELPFPAYELFGDLHKYSHPQPLLGWRKPVVNIITSRGCPFGCYFCYKGTFGRVWRSRSPINIVEEWEYLIKVLHVKEIAIQDDLFNMDIQRAKKIMQIIIEKGLKIPFTFPNGIRADLLDEELVKLMREAGLYRTGIGIESGVQEVLDDIGKNEKLEKIEIGIRLLKKYHIQTVAFFVMGNPKDTEKTMEQTIKFAKRLNPTFAQFTMATPLPGTRLYEIATKSGNFRIKKWDEYSQFDQKGYFDYEHLDGKTISNYVKKAYREFYLNPKFLIKMLTLKEFYINMPGFIKGLTHFLFKGK